MSSAQLDRTWRERAEEKRNHCREKIPREWRLPSDLLSAQPLGETSSTNVLLLDLPRKSGIMSERELTITTDYNVPQLVKELAAGSFTAVEVTTAFCKRSAIAQQLTNCLTEIFYDRALDRARFLDEYFLREGKTMGPFHGIPISIKDSFNVKGLDATIGYVSFLDHPPAKANSALVDIFLELGAVLYVKTNVPQTLMTADSDNNIFGRTLNPHRLNLTAGGSSGGEGALVAFRGSILGAATDIAGSIRIPSLCCGTYGFKPTSSRVPYGGQVAPGLPGLPTIVSAAGPVANSSEDLEYFMNAVLGAKPWQYDSGAHAVEWRAAPKNTPQPQLLRIGVLAEEPRAKLHPPIQRTVAMASKALSRAGHTLIELPHDPTFGPAAALDLAVKYFALDPSSTAMNNIKTSGEPPIKSVQRIHVEAKSGSERMTIGMLDLAGMNRERMRFSEAWREIWNTYKLDVVLAPGAQHTAVKHDTYASGAYTVIWNLLDYPASILPMGNASKELDPEPREIAAPGPSYHPEEVDGAPCAVQIIGPRFQDEACLRAAGVIDGVLRSSRD